MGEIKKALDELKKIDFSKVTPEELTEINRLMKALSSDGKQDEPEEEEEPEPAPRKYNEYGEIREWEPEPEPEMEDIPTVSRVMGQPDQCDEISLDDLLDEIIKAGD